MSNTDTNTVTVTNEDIHAAGIAVSAIDSSRRVGWAKAFDAQRRADNAERDVNMLRSDVAIYRRFAARAFGALVEIAGTGPVNDLFDGDCGEIRKSFEDGPYQAGQVAGRNLITRFEISLANNRAKLAEVTSEQKTQIIGLKREIGRLKHELTLLGDKASRAVKNQVVDEIVAEFGFADRQEFWEHLAATKGRP